MIKNAFGVRTQSTTSPDTSPTISGSLIYRIEDTPNRITKRKAKRRQQKDKSYKINILWDFFYCLLATINATKRSLTDKK